MGVGCVSSGESPSSSSVAMLLRSFRSNPRVTVVLVCRFCLPPASVWVGVVGGDEGVSASAICDCDVNCLLVVLTFVLKGSEVVVVWILSHAGWRCTVSQPRLLRLPCLLNINFELLFAPRYKYGCLAE